MITEEELFNNKQYKFEHVKIHILRKDDGNIVDVYAASYRRVDFTKGLTPALREANLLWNPNSGKRPPGYVMLAPLIMRVAIQVLF